MSSLSTVEARLPPGFRFHPRDEELICDYLMKWISGFAHPFPSLIQVDLNKCEPWDIPVSARVGGKEWYFYSQRDKKYGTGLRTNRATISGYWKATGKDRPVTRKGSLVGMRKTLVFYQGRAPKGRKTDWVMHEFRLEPGPKPDSSSPKEDWVLCRVFFKSRQELIIPGNSSELETAGTSYDVVAPSTPCSLPQLTQYNITFDNQYHQIDHQEQVPCFSIFDADQTSPNFSLITHADPPARTSPPTIFAGAIPDLGNIGYSAPAVTNDPSSSSCDKKVIRAVLNHLTKMETHENNNNNHNQCSSSFGEGSSDSYLSEVGLSSMWNHY